MPKIHPLLAAALCAVAAAVSTMGCALIAAVDRTQIEGGGGGGVGRSGGQGGARPCNDKVKGGTETDVDCGGGCEPCAQGKICSVAGDCTSGFCANGVCCDTACAEPCLACTATLKVAGDEDGICGQAKEGTICSPESCVDSVHS